MGATIKTGFWWSSILVCAAVAFNTAELRASDPVGVYCIVEKVVLEPNESTPNRAQVWGASAKRQTNSMRPTGIQSRRALQG